MESKRIISMLDDNLPSDVKCRTCDKFIKQWQV